MIITYNTDCAIRKAIPDHLAVGPELESSEDEEQLNKA